MTAADDPDPADTKATVTLTATDGGYGSADSVVVDITVEDDEEATISVSDDFENAEIVEGGTLDVQYQLVGPSGGRRDGARKPAGDWDSLR